MVLYWERSRQQSIDVSAHRSIWYVAADVNIRRHKGVNERDVAEQLRKKTGGLRARDEARTGRRETFINTQGKIVHTVLEHDPRFMLEFIKLVSRDPYP